MGCNGCTPSDHAPLGLQPARFLKPDDLTAIYAVFSLFLRKAALANIHRPSWPHPPCGRSLHTLAWHTHFAPNCGGKLGWM